MNLENIKFIAAILSQTGFTDLQYELIKHICCKPIQFVLTQKVPNGNDQLTCHLHFERQNSEYRFTFYDAALIKKQPMPPLTISQVELQKLEAAMQSIDWTGVQPEDTFRIDDEATWKREGRIETVIADLARLYSTPDGRAYADMLKVTFWSDTLTEELTGSLAPVRSRLEVSQRFFVSDTNCISVDEAQRFLQNKWIEKKLQLQRKDSNRTETEEAVAEPAGSAKGLLKKKRKVRVRIK